MGFGQRLKLAANVIMNTKAAVTKTTMWADGFAPVGNMASYLTDNYTSYVNKGYAYNSDVYSIVSMINEKIASCPILLYEVKDEKGFEKYKSLIKGATPESFGKAQQLRAKSLNQIQGGHKVTDLINKPNDHQDRFSFIENLTGYYNLSGNSYGFGIGPEGGPDAGKFDQIYVVPSGMVNPVMGDFYNPVKHYDLMLLNKLQMGVDVSKVMHIRNFNPDPTNPLKGMSPLKAGLMDLTRSNSAREAGIYAFQNGGARGLLFDNSSDNQESQWMTEAQADKLQERFDYKSSGVSNYNKTIVTASKVKWEKIGLSPIEMEILVAQGVDLRGLCNIWHAPSELFNDKERSANNNVKEAEVAFVRRACMPTMYRITGGLNNWLLPSYNTGSGKRLYLDFDYSAFPELHSDFEKLSNWLKDSWDLTPNEKRAAKDYDAIEAEGMNDIWVPKNFIPLSRMSEVNLGAQPPSNQPDSSVDNENPKKELYSILMKEKELKFSQLVEATSFTDAERLGKLIAEKEGREFIEAFKHSEYVPE